MTLPNSTDEIAADILRGKTNTSDTMKWILHVTLLLDRLKEHRDWLRGLASVVREDDFGLRLKRAEQLYVDWTQVIFHLSAREVEKSLNPPIDVDDKVQSLLEACRDVKFRTCGMAIGPATVDSETMRKMFEALKQFEDQK